MSLQTLLYHGNAQFDTLTDNELGSLTEEQFDTLPFGVVQLDEGGRIILYNQAEETIARRTREEVYSKHFFEEVAPCTHVSDFYGRWERLKQGEEGDHQVFSFRFLFPWGTKDVRIRMVLGSNGSSWLLISILTKSLTKPEVAAKEV